MREGSKTPRNLKRLSLVLSITAAIGVIVAGISIGLTGCYEEDQGDPNVDLINQAIADAGAHWTAAETWVSRLPFEERQKLYGVPMMPDENKQVSVRAEEPTAGLQSLPDRFTWQNNQGHDWMSGVRDQRSCGACVVFCIIGVMETAIRIGDGDPNEAINLSEQHLVSCVEGSCNTGWHYTSVFEYILHGGVPDEDCFYYQFKDLDCGDTCDNWQARATYIGAYWEIGSSINVIKQEVMRAPITTSFKVYEDFNYYKSGVYEHVYGDYEGGHAVVILGWDDDPADAPGKSCWVCRNSWGSGWGEKGYFRIVWGDSNLGNDNNYALLYEGTAQPPPPPTNVKAINRYSQGVAGAALRQIDITWSEEPTGTTYGFHVYRSETNGYSGMSRITDATSPVKTNHYEYTPPNGDTDQVFYFAVKAALASGSEGDFSNIAQNLDP